MLIRKNSNYRFIGRTSDFVDKMISQGNFETQEKAKELANSLIEKNKEINTVFIEVFNKNCKMWLPVFRIGE